MSVSDRLRTVLCGAVLEIGALTGIPMRPEQICELMRTLNQPKIAHTLPERTEEGDDGAEALPPGSEGTAECREVETLMRSA